MVDEKLTVLSPRLGKNGGCEAVDIWRCIWPIELKPSK